MRLATIEFIHLIATLVVAIFVRGGKNIMKCPSCGADSANRFCPFCGCEMPQRGNDGFTYNDYSHGKVVNNYFYSTHDNNQVYRESPWYESPLFENRRRNAYYDRSRKSKGVAWIVCLFLGMIGGHYFYVGRPGMGIVYMFTGGVGGLGWMYDLYRIAVGDFVDGRGEYL